MNPKWIVIATLAACLQEPHCDAAMPGMGGDAGKPEVTDEVLVRGTRLRDLRRGIVDAEERFYARYNELNKVDDYDIDCSRDAHTGSKIPRRRCLTRLQLAALAQHGKEVVEMFQEHPNQAVDPPGQPPSPMGLPNSAGMTGAGRPPNTDPVAIWLARFDDYRDNMLYLLKMNPDLRRLAQARENAELRYEAERKRRLSGRLVLFE